MKKALLVLIGITELMVANAAMGAVTIKKAATVSSTGQTTSATASVASFLPTVVNLVTTVRDLNTKQKELTADCIPTSQEISFVDATVKEWAKTGAMTVEEIKRRLDREECQGGRGYEARVRQRAGTEDDSRLCFDYYTEKNTIWYGYPKVGTATYCPDGTMNCSDKSKKHASDIYDIFNLIDFAEEDYITKQDATMAAKLLAKTEQCSYAKLSAKKQAMWGEFLLETVSNVGQSTNTGDIMQTVSSITNSLGSGGGLGSLSSLGSFATKLMDK